MTLLPCLEKIKIGITTDQAAAIIDGKLILEEFDKSKHMSFAKNIMDMDEELARTTARYHPAIFDDEESFGKISYDKYIDLLLNNNWRLFIAIHDNKCIGYIHTSPGKYKDSVYIGSFIVTKHYAGKGYGKLMLIKFEELIKNEYSIMILNVAIDNKPAIRLYEKDGFHPSFMMMSKKLK